MKYIILEENTISNIINADEQFANEIGAFPYYNGAEIGKSYFPPEIKEQKILQSKTDLQTYLAKHPLQWTDGNYYTITEQKQNQLTRAFAVYEIDTALGLNPVLEWNDTDEKCREWSKEELSLLASSINQRVRPLVKYQQAKEVEIRNAQTLEELNAITVNYDEVV